MLSPVATSPSTMCCLGVEGMVEGKVRLIAGALTDGVNDKRCE